MIECLSLWTCLCTEAFTYCGKVIFQVQMACFSPAYTLQPICCPHCGHFSTPLSVAYFFLHFQKRFSSDVSSLKATFLTHHICPFPWLIFFLQNGIFIPYPSSDPQILLVLASAGVQPLRGIDSPPTAGWVGASKQFKFDSLSAIIPPSKLSPLQKI